MTEAAQIIELPTAAPEKKVPKRQRPEIKRARYSPDEAAEFTPPGNGGGVE